MSTNKRKINVEFDNTMLDAVGEFEREIERFHASIGDYQGSRKRVKLNPQNQRTVEMRSALLECTSNCNDAVDIILQYARGASNCDRDKWYCNVCGGSCLD